MRTIEKSSCLNGLHEKNSHRPGKVQKELRKQIRTRFHALVLTIALVLSLLVPGFSPARVWAEGGPAYTIAKAKKKLIHQSKVKNKYKRVYGIDVSRWNDKLDWAKLKESGVEFAIIQIGYRNKQSGKLEMDYRFKENIKGAYDNDIDIGIYYVTQALNTKEAKQEAKYCIKHLKKYKKWLSYPIYIDIEPHENCRFDKANLSKRQKTNICKKFCKTLKDAGYESGVYTSGSFYYDWLYASELEKYSIWMANYTRSTKYGRRYDMWQFTSVGKVSGCKGGMDLDVAYMIKKPAAPSNLEQTDLSTNALTLSWSPVAAADGYKVTRYDEDGEKVKTYSTDTHGRVISGLEAGKGYTFKVRSYYLDSKEQKVYSNYSDGFTAYTLPDKMSAPYAKERTDTSLTLGWKKVPGADAYTVYSYDPENGMTTELGTAETNSFTVEGLEKKKAYSFIVAAGVTVNGNGTEYGELSEPAVLWTGTPAISGVKLSQVTKNSGKLAWEPQQDEDIVDYNIQVRDSQGGELFSQNTQDETFVLTGLEPGERYSVRVCSCYINDQGQKVEGTVTEKLLSTVPDPVKDVKQKSAGKTSLKLSWQKIPGAAGYEVFREVDGSFQPVKSVKKAAVTVKGLEAATVFTFKIRAFVNNDGAKQYGDYGNSFKGITRPANVTGLRKKIGKKKITITWKKVPGASGYQVSVYDRRGRLKSTCSVKRCEKKLAKGSSSVVKVRAFKTQGKFKAYSAKYKGIRI